MKQFTLNNNNEFILSEDRPDYLYQLEPIIEMKGNSYRTRRSDLNKLLRNFPELQVEELTNNNKSILYEEMEKWIKERNHPTRSEYSPTDFNPEDPYTIYYWDRFMSRKLLLTFDSHTARGLLLTLWSKPVGMIIYDQTGNDVITILAGKLRKGFEGGLTLLFQKLGEKISSDIKYLNLADDGGVEGLKNMKNNLNPCQMVERYTVELNTQVRMEEKS
jgi:hypothetical protein